MADRHGEFTTHQPSPPVCLVVKCVDVKRKKNEFKKKYLTFSPVSPCQKKKPQEKSSRSTPQKISQNVNNSCFKSFLGQMIFLLDWMDFSPKVQPAQEERNYEYKLKHVYKYKHPLSTDIMNLLLQK